MNKLHFVSLVSFASMTDPKHSPKNFGESTFYLFPPRKDFIGTSKLRANFNYLEASLYDEALE